jgi:hypothetical protein
MFNTIVRAGAVGGGAGAASRYGSGSDQKMRLLAAPAPLHWGKYISRKMQEMNVTAIQAESPYKRFLSACFILGHSE